jgi:hypothetical protein
MCQLCNVSIGRLFVVLMWKSDERSWENVAIKWVVGAVCLRLHLRLSRKRN